MATTLALLSPIAMNKLQNSYTPAVSFAESPGGSGATAPTSSTISPAAVPLSPAAKAPVPQLSPVTSARKRHRPGQNVFDFKRIKTETTTPTTTTSTETSMMEEVKVSSTSAPIHEQPGPSQLDKRLNARRQQTLSEYVLACLANYGLCVLDNFMGSPKAAQILQDVKNLEESGVLKSGKTVQNEDQVKNVRKVRQDKIAFVLKNKSQCIDDLVYKLDNLLTNVQLKSKQDPRFGGKKFVDFSGRTRAMVSCYPGNGTHYERHVDNHNRDGRCVTVVYYLNKDWNTEVDGGLLKVYPKQVHPKVAKIEPRFDRALIFWSDERNPHEVLPAFRNRYAVTLWYFDKEERQKALEQHKTLGECGAREDSAL